MIYGTKDKSQIVNSILDSLQQNAGIAAVQPGSVARAFAEAMGSEIADLYSSLSFTLRQGGLSTASGRNLDLIGDLYNVRRKDISDNAAAERQSYNIEFYIQTPYSVDIVIPKGTIIYTNVDNFSTKQYKFKLNGVVTIGASTTRAYGLVIPDFTDNTYTAPIGSLTRHNFISPPGVVLYCNNPKEVYAIINSESDDNYRTRIIGALKTRTAGTVEAVRFAALSIKGVKDVRLRESSYGLGSCDVIIVPESTAEIKMMPEMVYNTIINVKPVGVRFNIRVAEKISVNVMATITISSAVSESLAAGIRNQAALFVRRYLNSSTVGTTISISEIERQIKLSSDYIRSVTINSFNADGKEIPLKDFTPSSDKIYAVAGSVSINSVIMGINNY
jgi:uncharacterized phage protein gp47/JayE